ncbi:hypothetical protein HOG98_08215 [bacterium]|nr:hypothetical protein [bacterium]
MTFLLFGRKWIFFIICIFLIGNSPSFSEDMSDSSLRIINDTKLDLILKASLGNNGGIISSELKAIIEQGLSTSARIAAYFDESTIQYIAQLSLAKDIYTNESEGIVINSLVSLAYFGAEEGVNGNLLHSRLNIRKTIDNLIFFSGLRFPILNGVSSSISSYSGELNSVFGYLGARYMFAKEFGVTAAYYDKDVFLGVVVFDIPILFNMSDSSAKSTYLGSYWYN